MSLISKLQLKINRLDAHHKLYISLGAAFLMLIVPLPHVEPEVRLMLSWLTYVFISVGLSWVTILTSHPADVKHEARAQDSSRKVIFIFVIIAAFASLFAILILLQGASAHSKEQVSTSIIIPLTCVISSWWLVHTLFTLRYADFYYFDTENDKKGKQVKDKGLIFPNDQDPDYLDFTYFSFVIGMTFQVSDVQITSRRIRRLALMHGLLSFAFNTFIVAFTINIIAGLIQK